MFEGLSMVHIAIIAVIALIVLGPEKFPEYAKIALRAYRDFRGYVDGIKRDMAEELHPIGRELSQLSRYNPEDYIEKLTAAVSSIASDDKPATEAPAAEATSVETASGETKLTEDAAVGTAATATEPAPTTEDAAVGAANIKKETEQSTKATGPSPQEPAPPSSPAFAEYENYMTKGAGAAPVEPAAAEQRVPIPDDASPQAKA